MKENILTTGILSKKDIVIGDEIAIFLMLPTNRIEMLTKIGNYCLDQEKQYSLYKEICTPIFAKIKEDGKIGDVVLTEEIKAIENRFEQKIDLILNKLIKKISYEESQEDQILKTISISFEKKEVFDFVVDLIYKEQPKESNINSCLLEDIGFVLKENDMKRMYNKKYVIKKFPELVFLSNDINSKSLTRNQIRTVDELQLQYPELLDGVQLNALDSELELIKKIETEIKQEKGIKTQASEINNKNKLKYLLTYNNYQILSGLNINELENIKQAICFQQAMMKTNSFYIPTYYNNDNSNIKKKLNKYLNK